MSYRRIISLVPSLTELLVDLGLTDRIIGRTRFCIHPSEIVSNIEIIGGTKNPNIDKIREIKPDIVIANKEENRKEDVEALRKFCDVVVTEIDTVDDALFWLGDLGKKLDKQSETIFLKNQIRNLLPVKEYSKSIPTAYFIWKDPWMSVGKDTYIHDIMKKFGLQNVFAGQTRYPETTIKELIDLNPTLILLSSEPYPFKQKHIDELKSSMPDAEIQLIDGEWFSWYGSRMLTAFKQLKTWRDNLSI